MHICIRGDGGGALTWTGRETEPIINIIIGRPWGTAALTLARIAGVEFLTRNYGCILYAEEPIHFAATADNDERVNNY